MISIDTRIQEKVLKLKLLIKCLLSMTATLLLYRLLNKISVNKRTLVTISMTRRPNTMLELCMVIEHNRYKHDR